MHALLLAAVALPQVPAPPAPPLAHFMYSAGDVYVAVEHTVQREQDGRIGFAIATSHTTERRYTVLQAHADGTAEVLVEERTGPQQLHEYLVRGRDARAAHLQRGFAADATVRERVLLTTFTPRSFRSEPARDEPAVFYLQELPELWGKALQLPGDAAARWSDALRSERLTAEFAFTRTADTIAARVTTTIRDDRVHGGEPLVCPPGSLQWRFDSSVGLPTQWRFELQYPRFPIDRPNRQVVTGELLHSKGLEDAELAALRDDVQQYRQVQEAFFAGRFPTALAAAAEFAAKRADSRLAAAMQRQVEAFHRQVPRYGQTPEDLRVLHWFGGQPTALAELRGQVVVLDFWAVWCVPCIAGMGHLIELQQRYRGDGLQVLGLTRLDERQTVDAVHTFHATGYAAAHDGVAIDYPLAILDGDQLHDWFAVRAIPKLVVIDRLGRVYWEQTGSGGQAKLDRIVASALAEPR